MSDVSALLRPRALLLDFDGPVCSVFAGHSAHTVGVAMRRFLEAREVTLPGQFDADRDPIKLLAWVGRTHPHLTIEADDFLQAQETASVESAAPTPGAADVIARTHADGTKVAIVSNNSSPAIVRYLDLHNLSDKVAIVMGRPYGHPELMKPDPHVVRETIVRLDGVMPAEAVLIGDSPSDIRAAHATDVWAVGYAKTPDRRAGLLDAGADLVIDDMRVVGTTWEAA